MSVQSISAGKGAGRSFHTVGRSLNIAAINELNEHP
jgi:hypothetical protein